MAPARSAHVAAPPGMLQQYVLSSRSTLRTVEHRVHALSSQAKCDDHLTGQGTVNLMPNRL